MGDDRMRKVMELQQVLTSLGRAQAEAAAVQRAVIILEQKRDRLRREIHRLSQKENHV